MVAGALPTVPDGSPPWAIAMLRNVVTWVLNLNRGPQALTPYTTALRPTGYPRSLLHDSTLDVPAYSNAAGTWAALQPSGGAASFTTLSITAGAVISGTYTPTLTNVANLDASTAYAAQYIRVGNVVNVSGKVDVDPTALLSTKLGISLPIASTLSAAEKCSGSAVANSIASEAAAIEGDTANNRAQMEWITVSAVNHSMYYDFQYLIT